MCYGPGEEHSVMSEPETFDSAFSVPLFHLEICFAESTLRTENV